MPKWEKILGGVWKLSKQHKEKGEDSALPNMNCEVSEQDGVPGFSKDVRVGGRSNEVGRVGSTEQISDSFHILVRDHSRTARWIIQSVFV